MGVWLLPGNPTLPLLPFLLWFVTNFSLWERLLIYFLYWSAFRSNNLNGERKDVHGIWSKLKYIYEENGRERQHEQKSQKKKEEQWKHEKRMEDMHPLPLPKGATQNMPSSKAATSPECNWEIQKNNFSWLHRQSRDLATACGDTVGDLEEPEARLSPEEARFSGFEPELVAEAEELRTTPAKSIVASQSSMNRICCRILFFFSTVGSAKLCQHIYSSSHKRNGVQKSNSL